MTVELNNPTAVEPVATQEPSSGLESTENTPVEGTEAVAEQSPQADSGTKPSKGVDLNKAISKLSKEEQEAYKAFQAEYTKSRQSVSQYEEYFNALMNDKEFVEFQEARKAKAQPAEKEPDFSKMTEEEYFRYQVRKEAKAVADEQTKELRETIAQLQAAETKRLADQGNKIISDFATSKNISTDEAKELAKYAVSHQVSMDEAYKVAYFDKIPVQAKQDAIAELEVKKKSNLELGNTSTNVSPVIPERPTFREAAEAAAKQTGLKW